MTTANFSNLESQILSLFNQGKKTFDDLLESAQIGEKTLNTVLEGLISKNILQLNPTNHQYEYQTKVNGDIVILDGNILLPTTIIRLSDKTLICRGAWYEFPADFDVRRIIWNVKLENKTNSTLVDLIKSSVLKVKKSKIVQLTEYENLQNKVVPYSKFINLILNVIGEEVTDVTIVFKIQLTPDAGISTEFKGFKVNTEISTQELLTELRKPVAERNYPENIRLNKIYNFSDFVFSKNEIPVSLKNGELSFVRITGIRKTFELTYCTLNESGVEKKIDVESFENSNEAIEKLRDIFKGLPSLILSQNNFISELSE